MRAAIASRVSTGPQAHADRNSLAYQREAMERFCAVRGWEIVARYEIPGESAFKWRLAERPEFNAIVEAAQRREFDTLVLYDLSRLARNQRAGHEVRFLLRDAGVEGWSASGDYNWVADGMRAGMELMVAEQYSADHSRRLLAAFEAKHQRQLPLGRVPFGWKREGKGITQHEEEAPLVAQVFQWRASGLGYGEIAERLNASGLSPHSWKGKTWWEPASVQSLLTSVIHRGDVVHHGHVSPGAHAPIVDAALWQAAQDAGNHHAQRSRAPWLLSGLAACHSCAGSVWQASSGRPGAPRFYRDAAVSRRSGCPSAGLRWSADDAEAKVRDIVVGLALDERWIAEAVRASRNPAARQAFGDPEKLQAERVRVSNIYRAGVTSETQWRAELAAIDARLQACTPVEPEQVLFAATQLRSLGDIWDRVSLATRRDGLRTLFRQIPLSFAERQPLVVPRDRSIERLLAHRRQYVVQATGNRSYTRPAPDAYAWAELVAS